MKKQGYARSGTAVRRSARLGYARQRKATQGTIIVNDKQTASGSLFCFDKEPEVFGFLVIGGDRYELVGVKRSNIRTDIEGRKIIVEQQTDMFDDGSGDGAG
jgi:hypothetical protein